jgi:hypothetical protein
VVDVSSVDLVFFILLDWNDVDQVLADEDHRLLLKDALFKELLELELLVAIEGAGLLIQAL